MMLSEKERAWIEVLIKQAATDADYMVRWANDPQSTLTRGMAERHREMAQWLRRLLQSHEFSTSVAAVREREDQAVCPRAYKSLSFLKLGGRQ